MSIIYIDASVDDIEPVYRVDNFNKQFFSPVLGRIATYVLITEYSGHV